MTNKNVEWAWYFTIRITHVFLHRASAFLLEFGSCFLVWNGIMTHWKWRGAIKKLNHSRALILNQYLRAALSDDYLQFYLHETSLQTNFDWIRTDFLRTPNAKELSTVRPCWTKVSVKYFDQWKFLIWRANLSPWSCIVQISVHELFLDYAFE